MSVAQPIRVATAALSERIFAGRPTKDGRGFKEPRYDVTSDVLRAVRDKVGIGNEITIECDGVPAFRIAVLPTSEPECDCMEVFGENPRCPFHGEGTDWDEGDPPADACRQSAIAELCEGLEKAATWFEEYAGAHDRKMREAVDSYEKARRADKAIRNAERAKELRALLSKHSPDAPGQHAGTRATESGDGDEA